MENEINDINMINARYLQHVPFEGPANLFSILADLYIASKGTHLYLDEELPDLPSFDLLLVMGGPMGVHDDNIHPRLVREKKFITPGGIKI